MRRPELHPRTAIINRTQKNASRRTKSLALSWLAEKFPQAFDTTQRIRPLKKGIMNDILAYAEEAAVAGLSKSKLREAVVVFTRRLDYLACLKAKEVRVDLLGNTVEHVTLEEAERAAGKIKKRIEKIDTDFILGNGMVEQFIEDNSFMLFPQILSTERPDRASSFLMEGLR